ncbi:hypothetical protein DVB88_20740, partial [Tsukamurella pulmonis]
MAAPPAPEPETTTPRWSTARLIAFRLLFTVGGGLLILSVFGSLQFAPVMSVVQGPFARVGALATGTDVQLPELNSSGDSLGIWQYHIGWAVIAVLITAVWTMLDRGRSDYRSLGGLLWQVGRIAL